MKQILPVESLSSHKLSNLDAEFTLWGLSNFYFT